MQHGATTIRFTLGLALVLALAAAMAPFAGSRALAQENGAASITIYTTFCPNDFVEGDDLFEKCYDNPLANVTYELLVPGADTPLSATSGATGFAAFEGLTVEGWYDLQVQYPFNLIWVDCSEDGNPFLSYTQTEIVNQISLGLTTANDIRCDFYVPADASGGAQQTFDMPIAVYNCPTDPGRVGFGAFNIPDECDPVDGVRVTVALEDGTAVGECTTGSITPGFASPGLCKVAVPIPSTVVVTEETATLSDDFVPRENPLTEPVRGEFSGALFNLPDDLRGETPAAAPTQAPLRATVTVSALPNTGAGGTAVDTDGFAALVVAALAAIGLAGAGLVWQRRGA